MKIKLIIFTVLTICFGSVDLKPSSFTSRIGSKVWSKVPEVTNFRKKIIGASTAAFLGGIGYANNQAPKVAEKVEEKITLEQLERQFLKALETDQLDLAQSLLKNPELKDLIEKTRTDCMADFNYKKSLKLKRELIEALNADRLDVAETILQNADLTNDMKSEILCPYNLKKADEEKVKLLIRYGAVILENNFYDLLRTDDVEQIKIYLSVSPDLATDKVLLHAHSLSEEVIKLLLDHGANIEFSQQQKAFCYFFHYKDIKIKLLEEFEKEKNIIMQATDLTEKEKELLLNAFEKIDIEAVFRFQSKEYLMRLPILDISEKLLLKYFPLGLWVNNQKYKKPYQRFKDFLNINNPFEAATWTALQDCLESLRAKKDLTLTEQLLINLATNNEVLGKNKILSGKLEGFGEKYYKSGFAGDLLKATVTEKSVNAEKDLTSQGFETFFHGRNWEWNFVNDIWNIVSALKSNSYDPNKITMRFRDPDMHYYDIEKLQDYRKDLMKFGAAFHIGTGANKTGKESEVTFMNKTIVSNPGYYGECTGTYFIDNRSISDQVGGGFTFVEKIFGMNGLQSYYDQHKDEIKALYDQHKKTNKFGELLCIAVKKEAVDEMVYPAVSGGFKVNKKASENIRLSERCAKARNSHVDARRIFYCFAVSDIPGEYGTKYKIQSINLADPVKYAEYQKALNLFFEKMKQDTSLQK